MCSTHKKTPPKKNPKTKKKTNPHKTTPPQEQLMQQLVEATEGKPRTYDLAICVMSERCIWCTEYDEI